MRILLTNHANEKRKLLGLSLANVISMVRDSTRYHKKRQLRGKGEGGKIHRVYIPYEFVCDEHTAGEIIVITMYNRGK